MTTHAWAGGPDPWESWLERPDIELHYQPLPEGVHGITDGVAHVWHDVRLLQVERRYTTRHEREHVEANHTGCVGGTEEARICHRAAKWLVPDPHKVADALIWADGNIAMAADHLWLPERGMRARLDLRFMHPAERALIQRLVLDAQI